MLVINVDCRNCTGYQKCSFIDKDLIKVSDSNYLNYLFVLIARTLHNIQNLD